jgi:hypothetical protein
MWVLLERCELNNLDTLATSILVSVLTEKVSGICKEWLSVNSGTDDVLSARFLVQPQLPELFGRKRNLREECSQAQLKALDRIDTSTIRYDVNQGK